MTVELSIVLVTYNSHDVVTSCIDAIRAHAGDITHEIVVADNASHDGTVDLVAQAYPDVVLVRRGRNDGLSAAINDGVRTSSGRNVAVLNPDVRITDGALEALSRYLDANLDVGIVAPKLLDDDGALQLSCRAFPGHATAIFNRYSFLTRLLPGNRYSRDYLMSDFDHASTRDVDWVSGAACMLPRRVFDAVGGWDPGYFMFNEDVDVCKRVHDVGFRVVYLPEAVVYHAIGVSKSSSPKMIVERHRSMWRYYRKHLRGGIVLDAITGAGIASRCAALCGKSCAEVAARKLRGR